MSGRVRVWCVRHAESDNVVSGRSGAVPAAALTPRGRDQAARAARVLAAEPISVVYCSSAVRARQTAAAVAAACGAAVVVLPELAEVGLGAADGTTDPAVRARTAVVLHRWVVEQQMTERVADGETGGQVLARMTAAFAAIAAAQPARTTVVVGHVASLTLALSRLTDLGGQVWGRPLPHAEPFLVDWDGLAWRCRTWPGPMPPSRQLRCGSVPPDRSGQPWAPAGHAADNAGA